MTLSTLTSRVSYPGPTAGPLPFPFRVTDNADLLVTKLTAAGVASTLAYLADFTTTGISAATGSVLLNVQLVAGETVTIRRAPDLTQETSLTNQGPYFGKTHEDEFDRLVMQIQSLQDEIARSIRLPESLDPAAFSMFLTPDAGKAVVGTGLGFTMAALDSSAVALPGEGRTVPTLSAYLADNAVYNLKDYGAKGDGVTDDSAAIAVWLSKTGILFAPPGRYVHTTSNVISGNFCEKIVIGAGISTQFVNKAAAGNPAFLLSGATYLVLADFGICGDVAYPNDGIKTVASGGQRVTGVEFRNLYLSPNGNGINLQDANTIWIDYCQYWPSGGGGATATPANLKHAILADGNSAVNGISIRGLNASNWATIAQGGSAIKWNTVTGSNGVTVELCELEGPRGDPLQDRAIELYNINPGFSLRCNFTENADTYINGCYSGHIQGTESASSGTYTLVGCINCVVVHTPGASLSIDATSVRCGARDSTFNGAGGYSNLGSDPVTDNVATTGSVRVANTLQPMVQTTLNVVSGAATAVWSAPIVGSHTYLISINCGVLGDAADYTLVGIVSVDEGSRTYTEIKTGGATCAVAFVGADLQITQNSGDNKTVTVRAIEL